MVAQQVPGRAQAAHEPLEDQVHQSQRREAREVITARAAHLHHDAVERGEHRAAEGGELLRATHRRPQRVHRTGRRALRLVGDVQGVGLGEGVRVRGDLRGGGVQPAPAPRDRHPDRQRRALAGGALDAAAQELPRNSQHQQRDPQEVRRAQPAVQGDSHDDQHGTESDRGSGQSQQEVHGKPCRRRGRGDCTVRARPGSGERAAAARPTGRPFPLTRARARSAPTSARRAAG